MIFRKLVSIIVLSLLMGFFAGAGNAQIPLGATSSPAPAEITLPDPLTPDAIRELVARMSDDQVRGMLLDRLDAVAAAEATPGSSKSMITVLKETWEAFYLPTVNAVLSLPQLFSKEAEAFSNFGTSFGAKGLLTLFGYLAIALAAGLVAEKLVNFLTKRWQGKQTVAADSSLWGALSFLFRRFLREILGLIAFYFVMRSVGLSLLSGPSLLFAAPFVTYLIWFPRLGAAISRLTLAPNRPDLRLVNINDRWTNYLHRNLIGLVFLAGFTIFIVVFNANNGLSMGEVRIGYWLTMSVHIYIAIIAWTAREGLTDMMLGTDPDHTKFDETISKAYPYFAVVVSLVMLGIVQIIGGYGYGKILLTAPHYTTMFWLLMAPAIDTGIRGLVRHLAPPMIGDGAIAETAYKAAKRSYIRIGRVVAGAIVALMIANAWNINLMNIAAAGVGEQFASNLIEFIMVSAVGYVIYELVSLWINRRLAKEQTSGTVSEDEAAGEGGGPGGSRLTTVLPLVRMTAQAAIAVIFGLVALSSLGIDTTPLLAGAGILGLAIGFGAQKLVTDIVSGVFFLIDDAFRVGEYVDVGGTMGSVEKISIRSMQLRHHRGLVHTIPYGEIAKLTNFSRDWVIMKLKFTVPFDTDPNKVKKIFKKIGAEMMADPLHKDGFLEPFKSQGVFDFDDVGMVIRGKFMAKPGAQFTIRKEIYNRVQNEFGLAGIEFARREVRVALPHHDDHDHLTEEENAAIAAAAGDAVQRQIEAAKETK